MHRKMFSPRSGRWSGLLALALLAGCASAPPPPEKAEKKLPDAPPVPGHSEVALEDGMRVVATTPEGPIQIDAGPGLLRRYTWDGDTRAVVLQPRQERWAGSLGIYYEGTPSGWKPHSGVREVDIEEGQLRFDSLSDAQIWMQIRRLHYVHTSNGLVVGWKRKPGALQVEVWQFYIDGKKPSAMPGAANHRMQVSHIPLKARH